MILGIDQGDSGVFGRHSYFMYIWGWITRSGRRCYSVLVIVFWFNLCVLPCIMAQELVESGLIMSRRVRDFSFACF